MNPAPKILFVSHEASRTGAPMFLLHFLRWLRRETQADFAILLGRGGPLEAEFKKLAPVLQPADFIDRPAELKQFGLIYSNTCCNSDLLDAIGANGLPTVTHFHELDLGYEWLGARRMAQIMRHSQQFIACADAVALRLRQVFNLPADRITRHYEMIDPAAVVANVQKSDAAALRREYDIPENACVLVGCGTLDQRKGTDLFVQLAGRVKAALGADRPLRCFWIGSQNSPDLLRALRGDVRKLGLEQNMRLVGEMASPHGLLALADIFCLTSREDPFPLVMLEAAALQKPIVCFAGAGGGGEFCALGGGVEVPYLDVAAMADACGQLLADPARGAAIGRLGEKAVRERFQVEAVAPALWRDLQALTVRAPAVPAGATLAEIYAGWNQDEAPQRLYRQAHLSRDAVRRRTRRLLHSGQRAEAAQLLVRAINADLATKDVWTICEGLCEISSDLEPVDSKQAELLLLRARDLARTNKLNIDTLLPRKTSAVAAAA